MLWEAMNADGIPRGTLVGRYVVLDVLGRGGMGVVYAAYDSQLDRKVALKLLHADGAAGSTGGGRSRLLAEAQAMARLSHPNVVAIHDVGTHGERVFLAFFVCAWHDKLRRFAGQSGCHVVAHRFAEKF